MRNIKLKDETEIHETSRGTFAIVFPNKRYMLITTWTGKVEIDIVGFGKINVGEIKK